MRRWRGFTHRFPSSFPYFAAALAVAVLAAAPLLLQPGLLNTRGGGDSPFLLQRLQQLETALLDGHFPVRWMPDANYGYGYPFFNFYAPLSIYVAAVFRLLGFSYVGAIEMAQLTGFLVAAAAMFRLARTWFGSDWAGLLTAVAYTVAPFHMVNVYVRGDSLAEFWAMAFYPLLILAVDGVLQSRAGRSQAQAVALLALSYAGLILSHNISALIFSPFLGLYILLQILLQSPRIKGLRALWAVLWPLLAGLLLALGLAAWFFVPALAEQSLAQLGPVTEGYFHFSQHFLGYDLVQTSPLFDYSVGGRQAFRMGLVQGVTAVIALLLLLGRQRQQPGPARLLFLLVGLPVATLMMTPWSAWLWQTVPLLPFTQFPWRFLSIQAWFIALIAAAFARLPWRRLLPLLLLVWLGAGLGGLRIDSLPLRDADVSAQALAQYEWFTGNIGSTVSAEYLPPTMPARAYSSAWLNYGERNWVQTATGTAVTVLGVVRETDTQQWRLQLPKAATVILPTLYWPGWQATVNGRAAPLTSAASGLMALELAAGVQDVQLRLERTPVRRWAELASLLALAVTLLLLWPMARLLWQRRTALWLLGLAGLLVLLRFTPPSVLPTAPQTWDFTQMGYLHHDVGGVLFADGSRLQDYSYSHEKIPAGDAWTLTLDWEDGARPTGLTVALVTPAANWPFFQPAPPFLLQAAATADGVAVTIPENAPPGLYLPRLQVENGRPLLPSGQARGELYLRPLQIMPGKSLLQSTPEQTTVVARAAMLRSPTVLEVQLAWWQMGLLPCICNLSLRLLDEKGQVLSQFDSQPGYGFLPSNIWPQQQWLSDWVALPMPQIDAETADLRLVVQLYEVGGARRLTRWLGDLRWRSQTATFVPARANFALAADAIPLTAAFAARETIQVGIKGYTLAQTAEAATLTLFWQAQRVPTKDFVRFVHLLPQQGDAPLAQVDSLLRGNSYPPSQMVPGEIVTDSVQLPLAGLAGGSYRLVVGLYQPEAPHSRLTAVADRAILLAAERLLIPEPVIVTD